MLCCNNIFFISNYILYFLCVLTIDFNFSDSVLKSEPTEESKLSILNKDEVIKSNG